MPVTSTTLAGVNVWQLSGNVTDAELKTAWAALITNGVYVINRAIYLDNTADLTGLSGGFLVDLGTQVNPGFILHTGRDKTKSAFKNFTFLQRTGLSVDNRSRFVMTWNGTALGTPVGADGLAQNGGGMIYGVVGNSGVGDINQSRFLNEMSFAGIEGATIYSQEFTEQELQIVISQTTELRGISFEKCIGFPQIGTPTGNVNVVVYRSSLNTQHPTQQPIRLFPDSGRWAAVCYVDSFATRNNEAITTNLGAFFNSSATNRANVMVANNYLDEKWFGALKTAMATMVNWNAANSFIGVVFKKLQFVGGDGAVIRAYDSRSTTVAQKCEFKKSGFFDFLSTNLAPTTDAEGKIWMAHVGAVATGAGPVPAITRYTSQRYTFQKFGFRVSVTDIDMTQGGDNDLSAFTPVILATQSGLVRTQAQINAATTITTYRELLEELHVMAIGLSGAASYSGAFNGNHFEYGGTSLVTDFTAVNVNPLAAQKIAYELTTDTLTVKASNLAAGTAVAQWRNPGGKINLLNGATITGVFEDSDGQRATVTGLDPEGFGITWFLRYRLQGTTPWTQISGTGNTALILLAEGTYDVQVRAPGYEWESALVLDTTISLSLNAGLRYQVSANNTPQYTMTYDAVLEAIFQYDATAMKVSVANTTSGILTPGFAELYQATQRIQHIPALVWSWTAPVTANATSQKILIPSGNPISMYLTDVSTNTVKITCPVIHADTGSSADDRVRGNASGYSIILGSPATAESAGLASQIISGLGGPSYDSEEHGLSVIEELVQQVKTLSDAINGRTALIPNAPAAVGDAMTLTAAYDAAKTAATQASVDAAAAKVTSIKATVEAMEPTDLSGIPGAVRTELATELGRIDVAVSTRSTLTAEDVPAGLTAAQVWSAETRTLTETAGLTPVQAAQLDALTTDVDALGQEVQAVGTAVANVPGAVRTELSTELGRIDVALSTRSTLTVDDIPEGLTAEDVWTAPDRSLTEAAGLTTDQAEQLRKVAQLHGVGVELVVTETSRTAGDVQQTLTTDEAGSTTVSAA